jgi:hypothetical protein
MTKWKLLLTTIPFVVCVLAVKLLLTNVFHFDGIIDFTDVALVLTGGIFLIGFMLAGTISDYKESEKIPGELACTLEYLEDAVAHACAVNQYGGKTSIQGDREVLDPNLYMAPHRSLVHGIYDWICHKKQQEDVYAMLHSYSIGLHDFEKVGGHGGAVGGMDRELSNIRKLVTRMGVISRTGFLATGYALLEMLIACIIILVMICKFKGLVAEVTIITFIVLIYVYMYRLIKDIDDPFEYSTDGSVGSAEVPLFPITEYIARFDQRYPASASAVPQTSVVPTRTESALVG